MPTAWWNDVGSLPCNCLPMSVGYVVEYDADCNGDGIVDFGQLRSGDLLDVNGDTIPDACQCLGDISGDGLVNGVDLAFVLSLWGTSGGGAGASDVTGDGAVDGMDLSVVLGGWGPCSSASAMTWTCPSRWCSAPLKLGQLESFIFAKITAAGSLGTEVLRRGGSSQALASS